MNIEVNENIIVSAIASNYNIPEVAVNLSDFRNRQILESLDYYLRYGHGSLIK